MPGNDGKYGHWVSSRTVLSFYNTSGIVEVHGNTVKPIYQAVEDVKSTTDNDEFAHHICQRNDQI